MITKIHHIGIVVRNLEEAYGFYRDTLGLCVSVEDTVVDQGVKAALMPVGHSEIELLEPIREGTGIAKFLESRGGGMHHLCFETDNVDAELARLKGIDTPLIDEQSRGGLAGMIAFLHPKCTHRTLVELATPPESHHGAHKVHGEAGLKELDWVTLAVGDLDAAAADYERLFGLRGERFDLGAMGGHGAMLPIGNSQIELLAATSPDSHIGTMIAASGEGMMALTLQVESLDAAVAHLKTKGVAMAPPAEGPLPGTRSVWIEPSATNGVRLRLIER